MITTERYTEDRLTADQKPKKFYSYYVSGHGDFPYDMLRYDSAWPATSSDASKLASPYHAPHHDREWRKRRSIKMHSYCEPTVARWSSFSWSVGSEDLTDKSV